MCQGIMTKIGKYACEVWIVLDSIVKQELKWVSALGEKMGIISYFMHTKSLFLENISKHF